MLRIKPSENGAAAKRYFTEQLARADYYVGEDAGIAFWDGKGAQRLGIHGQQVTSEIFGMLADNINPRTGERLTQRTRGDRIPGWDASFHPPKSVTLLHAMTGDDRIVTAMIDAVQATMRDLEQLVATRVRKGGVNEDRRTGNLIWAPFVHHCTRPVQGVPDPHMHIHCYGFNATFDAHEDRWKAAKFFDIKKHAPYLEACFHSRLAANLTDLGYACQRSGKSWELAGIERDLVMKFSNRTQQIEKEAARRGITNAKQKDKLGALTREKKSSSLLTREEVVIAWHKRLSKEDELAFENIVAGRVKRSPTVTHGQALRHAIEHLFTRLSVVNPQKIVETALRFGLGDVTPERMQRAMRKQRELKFATREGQEYATTQTVLREERAVLRFAVEGRGACQPLAGASEWKPERTGLNQDQEAAVGHLLKSKDRLMIVRGAAGTGKTTLLKVTVAELNRRDHAVALIAPSADAARDVLRGEGFTKADTVAKFLGDPEMQRTARKGIIICDEAGLVGTPTMARLVRVAEKLGSRVVLLGDPAQHAPVERGDALRLLSQEAGIKAAEVMTVVRQKDRYRDVVQALVKGKLSDAIAQLDTMGAIREIPDASRHAVLAQDYAEITRLGKSCLVVAPTHAEGEKVTGLIRAELKRTGRIGQDESQFMAQRDLRWTDAEKKDAARYEPGQIIRFHRNVKDGYERFKAGEVVRVTGRTPAGGVMVESLNGVADARALPVARAKSFSVFEESVLAIARGDLIRITATGRTLDRKNRVNNGAVYRCKGMTKEGHLKLENGWVLPRGFGGLSHGYCTTSHAAQGKSVDTVLIAQGWESIGASSAKQFYVSVTRGKSQVRIYTDNRKALLTAVRQMGERRLATDLFQKQTIPGRLLQHAIAVQRLRRHESIRERLNRWTRPSRTERKVAHAR